MDISNTILVIDKDEAMHCIFHLILDYFNIQGKIKAVTEQQEALIYLDKYASDNNFPKMIIACLYNEEIEVIKAIVNSKFFSKTATQLLVVASNPAKINAEELKVLGVTKVYQRPELPDDYDNLRF